MQCPTFTLRTILLLIVTLLTLMVGLLAAKDVYVNAGRLVKIHALERAILLSNVLFDATEKFSVERDVAVSMLHASDEAIIRELMPRLLESRKAADAALDYSMKALDAYPFPDLINLRKRIRLHLDDIRALRPLVSQALQQPKAKRDPTLAMRKFDGITELIQITEDLWVGFVTHFTDIDPIATRHLRVKHLLHTISDYSGRERAIIGRLLVERVAPSSEETAQLLRGLGRIEMSWGLSRMITEQSGLYPAVSAYYADAKSHYDTLHDMIRGMFYVPGAGYREYLISANVWFELSIQATDSFDALINATLNETQHYLQALVTDARRKILLHVIVLCAAMGLCAYSFCVIRYRVILPINTMVEALLKAARGEFTPIALPARRDDEIGKLMKVLEAFHAAEREVRESQERYRALIEASSQVIWTWKEGDLDRASPLSRWWEETTGQPADAIATFGWLDVVHPDDRDRVNAVWEKAMRERGNFEMEYRLRTRDGRYMHVAVRGVALLNAQSEVREFIGSLNDVTARKEAEAGLMRYMDALERSNKELDDFAYIASHDLKEPLRGIHNHSRFLLEDNADKLDQESIGRLGRLVYLSQRMERLVNDLLYFSRLGRQELAIQPTDIGEAIRDIETTLESFLQEHHVRIVRCGKLPTIVCDKPRVTELLRNLITNAVKYNDKSEKTVEIGFLSETEDTQGNPVFDVFYVRDNGIGIAPEFHQEIFRIFKRLQSAKGQEEGTGVGLTFVKKIIERHNGKIWLTSKPGVGTVFYFTLKGATHDIFSHPFQKAA